MTLREQFFEDTGIDDDPLTYQNDSGEFVIDERYYDWLEKQLQNTSSNSDYAKCPNHDHDLKGSWEYRQCNKCGEYVAVG